MNVHVAESVAYNNKNDNWHSAPRREFFRKKKWN